MNFFMRNQRKKVPTKFGAATRFEPTLSRVGQCRTARHAELERLKTALLEDRLEETWADRQRAVVRAANDAAALAWATPYPALVFPALFDEKVDAALVMADRQEEVTRTSRELLAV